MSDSFKLNPEISTPGVLPGAEKCGPTATCNDLDLIKLDGTVIPGVMEHIYAKSVSL